MLVVYDEMIYPVVTMRDENGKVLAVMSNPLLRRKLSLDVMQQHIFHIAVGQIKYPRDEKAKLPVFDIRVDAYAALTGRSPRQGSLYQQLKAAVKGLQHAEVALPGGERIAILAPYAEYIEGESRIEIDFNERLKPYILGIRKYFASIPVAEACQLRSGYAISFYLYCWSWYGSKERGWNMTIEELREWLSIGESILTRTCDLNTRVIEQARKELTAKASITFKPKAKREGRRTVGWFFEIKDNKPKRNRVPGAIELPEAAKHAQAEQLDARIASAKTKWEQATEVQRKKWLSQMDSVASAMAPQNGAEPRQAFLACLVSFLEPELPLI
jgi:plasmid replication initiation protein